MSEEVDTQKQQQQKQKEEEIEGGERESGESLNTASDETAQLVTSIRNSPTERHAMEYHPSSKFAISQKGSSQYKLVFMEELSSDSGLTAPGTVSDSGESHCRGEDTVSSAPLVAESNQTGDTLREGTTGAGEGVGGREEREGKEGIDGGEAVKHKPDIRAGGGSRGISPSDVVIESRPDSATPPPKPKEHALSRLTSDSDAAVTPPFSPTEYHSSEDETGQTHTFPIMTPSPIPPGTDSPLGDHPSMSILFSGVFYLGSSTVDAPISETEANRKMNILHEQALTSHPMPIILSVPVTNDGSVLLKDPKTDQPLTTFPVKMILFCVRGNHENLQDCFCLNVRHKRSGTYHCHVFRCEIMEAVSVGWLCRMCLGWMYMYMYIHVCICMYACMLIVYTCIVACLWSDCVCVCVCVCVCYVCVCAMCVCVCVCIHLHVYCLRFKASPCLRCVCVAFCDSPVLFSDN